MICAENAKEYQQRAQAAIKRRKAAEAAELARAAAIPAPATPDARRLQVEQRMDAMLLRLQVAQDDGADAVELQRLTNSLNTLWHLLNPSTGSLKPSKSSGRHRSMLEMQPLQPLPISCPEQGQPSQVQPLVQQDGSN